MDYLFVPRAMPEQVIACRAHLRCGAKLQAIRGCSPRDHVPLVCVARHVKHGVMTGYTVQRDAWNVGRFKRSRLEREGEGSS